jgi:ankyrin repeat protein
VLRHCLPASIRQTLEQLPESLDDTYLRVLRQIPQANKSHAHRMLQCLVVAVRPLRVEELAELLAFEFDAAPGGIPKYRPALRLDDQTQAVLSTCSSLVTIIDEWYGYRNRHCRRVVQFSHFSVKEFLVSNRLASESSFTDISGYHIRLGSAHTILTQACLGLLLYSNDHITKESVNHSPLADYAAENWVEHVQFEYVASCVKDGMETLFDPDKPHFETWVGIYDIDTGVYRRDTSNIPNPLYYSALCGFHDLVEQLATKHPHYVNAICGKYMLPLLAALGEVHVEVAELLLKHCPDVDVRETTGKTTLLVALSWVEDHYKLPDIVEFLLTHGADVNARDDTFTSPLHLAEQYGRQQVVTMLLNHKADVNSWDKNGKTPLHMLLESEMYHDDCSHVRLLLEHGAEVNIRDVDNQTPFLLALNARRFRTALLLLEHGAHANAQEVNRWDRDKETLLHLAIRWNLFKLPRILLEHGADSDAENTKGQTPLHVLSESDSIKDGGDILNLVLLLLKHGAATNKRDVDGETPLHLAIKRNRFKLAEILLENGADPDAENISGWTPFHVLPYSDIKNGSDILKFVLLLLKHGAAANKRDEDGETPLHLAIERNRFKLAEILLEHGADPNAENFGNWAPFHVLLYRDFKDGSDILKFVLLLLKHGTVVNSRDKDNRSLLHLSIQRNRFKVAEILLEHGADATAGDIYGQTPLHMLSESDIKDGNDILNLVLLLLKHGAAVDSRTTKRYTPLHLAIRRSRFKLAEILLKHGAHATAEDIYRQIPLHMLSESDIKDGSEILSIVLLLLKQGAAVNSRDENNETPFHLAIQRNRFKLAEILLENSADATAESVSGQSPLHMLSESDIKDGSDILDFVLLLLKHGAAMNSRTTKRHTPLHLAIQRNRFKLAEILLKHGAHATAEDIYGQTPLHMPSESDIKDGRDILSLGLLLLKHGAAVGSRTAKGHTPLHLAIRQNRLKLAEILFEHGADARAENKKGWTPLHMLPIPYIKDGSDIQNIVLLLLKHGAAVNSRNEDKETPLHLAIRRDLFKLSEILLKHGADAHAQNSTDKTPLHILSESWTRRHDNGDFANHAQSFLVHAVGVDRQDEDNKTSSLVGIGEGKYEFTEVITDLSADASIEKNVGDIKGDIAVRQLQASRDNPGCRGRECGLVLALESGTGLNVQEHNQMTPTYLQSDPGPFQIAVLLLYYGANLNIGNNGGESSIYQEIKGEYYICPYYTAINESLMY